MKDLVAKVSRVSLEDLKRVAPIYLSPLFDPQSVRRSVVSKPAAVPQVKEDFSKLGVELTIINLDDESSLVSKL